MLVDALRSKSFRKASCGGSHLLSSLTMILRSDQQCTILSEKCRHGLVEFLTSACTAAVAAQRDDGSWSINWHRRLVTEPEPSLVRDNALERLIATGHIAEWMLYLPKSAYSLPRKFIAKRPYGWRPSCGEWRKCRRNCFARLLTAWWWFCGEVKESEKRPQTDDQRFVVSAAVAGHYFVFFC